MRVLIVILVLILSGITGNGQDAAWGDKIEFGNAFQNTDSLLLRANGVTDSLYASGVYDTLYSKGIIIPADGLEGIYGVATYFTEVSGTSASISLDVRLGVGFTDGTDNNVQWDSWQHLITSAKSTLTRMGIVQSDSSWWNAAANWRQYRLREADADTVLHNVADFIR